MDIIFDVETTGLMDNLFERLICICVHNVDKNEDKVFVGEDEQKILTDFFSYLNSQDSPRLIGYNTSGFDIPFVIRRAVIYKKKVPTFNHADLRLLANGFFYSYNKMEKGRLRDWAHVLGIPVQTDGGSEMFRLYSEKKFEEIKNHCLEDIKITTKLYEHVKAAGLIN
jgi:3'-5' exonuclease